MAPVKLEVEMRSSNLISICALVAFTACAGAPKSTAAPTAVQATDLYYQRAAEKIGARAEAAPARAKNLILFVGDGMGVSTVTAARVYLDQATGDGGPMRELAMDNAEYGALSRTYSHNNVVSDSASTATAMTAGIKTLSGVLGVTYGVARECPSIAEHKVTTLFDLAEAAGRATGVVTTTSITHATPAAAYAHTFDRAHESDSRMGQGAVDAGCVDIARQLVEWPAGDGFEIALGGGRANFLPATTPDPERPDDTGNRSDGRDLTAEWAAKSSQHRVVHTAEAFAEIDLSSGAKVLGLFEPGHMQFELDRDEDAGGEPSLAEMTAAAITRLSQDGDGYVLLVEGGRIDHAHHGGNARRAIEDTLAFDAAIATALRMTDPAETLIVATADHSHTLVIQGYASRRSPILGLSGQPGLPAKALDGKPYTILAYTNGPGAAINQPRSNPADDDTVSDDYRQQALVPLGSETHAGEDVPVYAWGPGAAWVRGSMEQNEIFHVLARAGGLVE
jgi:alkaline phosphatase